VTADTYRFVDRWRVQGTLEEVTEIMTDAERLPCWWPAIYLSTRVLEPGDNHGVGKVVWFHSQGGRLLYTLRWTGRTVEARHPYGFRLEATGDFIGTADWTFEQDGPFVNMTLVWTIRVGNPLLRYASYVVKPILANNHRWAMRVGERSLRLELARRHARSTEELAWIPPPRPPVTAGRVLRLASVVLAAAIVPSWLFSRTRASSR
jgi:hypothetical protein